MSDEYDFLDEDEDAQDRRRQERRERAQRRKGPHHKYREVLQDLADRKIQEITVDLDDLANVRLFRHACWRPHADPLQFEESLAENLHLVASIEANSKHYVEILSRAIDKLLPQPSVEIK